MCLLRAMKIAGITLLKMQPYPLGGVTVMIHRVTLASNLTLQRVVTAQHKCFQLGPTGNNVYVF